MVWRCSRWYRTQRTTWSGSPEAAALSKSLRRFCLSSAVVRIARVSVVYNASRFNGAPEIGPLSTYGRVASSIISTLSLENRYKIARAQFSPLKKKTKKKKPPESMHQSPAAVERGLLILWIKLKSTTENAEFFSRITM